MAVLAASTAASVECLEIPRPGLGIYKVVVQVSWQPGSLAHQLAVHWLYYLPLVVAESRTIRSSNGLLSVLPPRSVLGQRLAFHA